MRVLLTGAAGFIGFHTARRLLADGHEVWGYDSVNAYYDPALKEARLGQLEGHEAFHFTRAGVEDRSALDATFTDARPDAVIHLAAQAGVRHSLTHPEDYVQANLVGFVNLLEACRASKVRHLVYASSSSVYGIGSSIPFREDARADRPVSLYAATKRANEHMAHVYAHLFGVRSTGLRFFTVYGPWGRPDMAAFIFTKAIVAGRPITLFNHGEMRRDFTYVEDVVEGVMRVMNAPPEPADDAFEVPHRVLNIGHHSPEELKDMVALLEKHIGKKAIVELAPMQPGDVRETYADVSGLEALVGYAPTTTLDEGLGRFVAWYREFYDT
ncbi:MAG: SDR family NAD(P)-dependent oxidoreductase [Myxococcota bacterium]